MNTTYRIQLPAALMLMLLFTFGASAQSDLADVLIMGTTQGEYTNIDAIKKARITMIRETSYKADTTTRKVDMNKPEKITLYSYAYLGDRPLIIAQVSALATDTTTVTDNYQWGYNNQGNMMAYQGASKTDALEFIAAKQVERDEKGFIKKLEEGVSYNLNTPPTPVTYTFVCTGNGKYLSTAKSTIIQNGNPIEKLYRFNFSPDGYLRQCEYGTEKEREIVYTYTYDNTNHLTKETSVYYSSYDKYIPATDGVAMFGVPGTPASTKKIYTTHNYEFTYEYDSQHNLVKMNYSSTATSTDPEFVDQYAFKSRYEYSYGANGLPETIKSFDEKGLTGLRKLVCR